MVSLPDYWQLQQCEESQNNNIMLTLRNKLSFQISMSKVSKDLVVYTTQRYGAEIQFTMIIKFSVPQRRLHKSFMQNA